MEAIDYRIVREELAIAGANVLFGVLAAVLVGVAASLWWLVVVATLVAGGVAAANDRGTGGAASAGVVLVAMAGLGGLWVTGGPALGVVPLLLVGAGLGFGLNRVVFGLLRPVPEDRRARELA